MAGVGRVPWWQWLPLPWRRWRVVVRVDAGDEVPSRLPRKAAALVGPSQKPSWVAFDCPCGTGHRLMVNLDRSRRPTWQVTSAEPLSVLPSIDNVTSGRRCHFFIRNGRVDWMHNEERAPA